jgi:hypothetical protein
MRSNARDNTISSHLYKCKQQQQQQQQQQQNH